MWSLPVNNVSVLFFREAVVAVDRQSERETEEFLPQKRSRPYGITTTTTQCPQGTALFDHTMKETGIKEMKKDTRNHKTCSAADPFEAALSKSNQA